MQRDRPLTATSGQKTGGGNRKIELEGRAAVLIRLAPDPAAVAMDDFLAGGETEAGAFEFAAVVQPLERLEDLLVKFRLDADAVVANADESEAFNLRTCRNVHRRRIHIAVLDAIADQVLEKLHQ